MNILSDEHLIKSCVDGNHVHCRQIYERYKSYAANLAYHMVRDQEAARDITQEAFLRVFKGLKKFKKDSSFKTWLYRIVTNQSIDYLRKRKSRRDQHIVSLDEDREATISDTQPSPRGQYLRKELHKEVRAAIDQLSPDHKAAILLCDMEGLSYSEIAEITGVPAATVGTRVHYARKKLRGLLKPYVNGNTHGKKL